MAVYTDYETRKKIHFELSKVYKSSKRKNYNIAETYKVLGIKAHELILTEDLWNLTINNIVDIFHDEKCKKK